MVKGNWEGPISETIHHILLYGTHSESSCLSELQNATYSMNMQHRLVGAHTKQTQYLTLNFGRNTNQTIEITFEKCFLFLLNSRWVSSPLDVIVYRVVRCWVVKSLYNFECSFMSRSDCYIWGVSLFHRSRKEF